MTCPTCQTNLAAHADLVSAVDVLLNQQPLDAIVVSASEHARYRALLVQVQAALIRAELQSVTGEINDVELADRIADALGDGGHD